MLVVWEPVTVTLLVTLGLCVPLLVGVMLGEGEGVRVNDGVLLILAPELKVDVGVGVQELVWLGDMDVEELAEAELEVSLLNESQCEKSAVLVTELLALALGEELEIKESP